MAKRKNMGLSWHWTGCCGGFLCLVAALILVFSDLASLAQDGAGASSSAPIAVALTYQETSFVAVNWPVVIATQSNPFAKEPVPANGKTIRGILRFGANYGETQGTNNAFAFIWQRDAGQLYLDLNQNQDFTDEKNGCFKNSGNPQGLPQTFSNLHLAIICGQGHFQVLANLNLYDFETGTSGTLGVRSLWQAKLSLGTKEWQIGIAPVAPPVSFTNGAILLRPWERHSNAFYVYDGGVNTCGMASELFFGGTNYQLGWKFLAVDGEIDPVLQLLEKPTELGELNLAGKEIDRLMLGVGQRVVLLDQPAGRVQVPAATYTSVAVSLERNGIKVISTLENVRNGKPLKVEPATPVSLNIGGPLTNSVAVTRAGQDVRLVYRLLGADGKEYQVVNPNRSQPPKFTVYKGGRAIATGDFEFG